MAQARSTAHLILARRRALTIGLALLAAWATAGASTALAATDHDGDGAIANDCQPLDPAVHPAAVDRPDLAFEDLNCDGVDGDTADAVFLFLGGNDAGSGTLQNPLKTFNAAITDRKSACRERV